MIERVRPAPVQLDHLEAQDVDRVVDAKCCSCGLGIQVAHFADGEIAVRHDAPDCDRFQVAVKTVVGVKLYALNCTELAK